jgi:predicted nuclease with TOPRIM domain
MQFAYLEEANMLESLLNTIVRHGHPEPVQRDEDLPDVELPEDWKNFQETLGRYQKSYTQNVAEVREVEDRLKKKRAEYKALTDTLNLLEGSSLKDKFSELVEEFEKEESLEDLEEYLQTLKATTKAMKQVLENTNTEQVMRFQCFVCMDKLVDTFLDPCGHVMCQTCWRRKNSPSCPVCRVEVRPKKIFTLT